MVTTARCLAFSSRISVDVDALCVFFFLHGSNADMTPPRQYPEEASIVLYTNKRAPFFSRFLLWGLFLALRPRFSSTLNRRRRWSASSVTDYIAILKRLTGKWGDIWPLCHSQLNYLVFARQTMLDGVMPFSV